MGKEQYVHDRIQQIRNYANYINNHIKMVQSAYDILRPYFLNMDMFKATLRYGRAVKLLDNNIVAHDKSKHSIEEFDGYAKRFYPIIGTNPEANKNTFDTAWLHHIHNNAHHPNHWVLYDDGEIKILDMPDIYIIEMLCDWIAMSWYHNNDLKEYWNSDSCKKLPMSEHTRSKTYDAIMYIYTIMQIDDINELKKLIR